MRKRLAVLAAFLAGRRTALFAWAGLLMAGQAVATATGQPAVVWPAALAVGLLAEAFVGLVIEWAANAPEVPQAGAGYQPRPTAVPQGKPPQGGTGTTRASG